MSHSFRLLMGLCTCALACADVNDNAASVRPGIEVLLTDSLHLVMRARVGILTNQTGIGRNGTGDIELLLDAGVDLTAIFSPEHGFRGTLNRVDIGHSFDSVTGLPIYSLYGDVRVPTEEMLAEVDVLVIDLQDIGTRTYTYISTALLAMQAAQPAGVRVLVTDRPNPIAGQMVQGPVLVEEFASFVGMLPVPLRHGLTIGELARFGNEVLGIGVELTVIPTDGWKRAEWFDATGLPWVRPSPNMPSLESASHYPGLVLFEGTNLSVGRGTPVAFQLVGAPWLRPELVLERVGDVPGALLSDTLAAPVDPSDGKYAGMSIPFLRLRVDDRATYDPVGAATAILAALWSVHRDSLEIRAAAFDQRAGSDALRLAVERGISPPEIAAAWEDELAVFREMRRQYLLYR